MNYDCIGKSEEIRNKLNLSAKKAFGFNDVTFPKFTNKPCFYKELDEFLGGDLLSPFKVQCNFKPVGLEHALKYRSNE